MDGWVRGKRIREKKRERKIKNEFDEIGEDAAKKNCN